MQRISALTNTSFPENKIPELQRILTLPIEEFADPDIQPELAHEIKQNQPEFIDPAFEESQVEIHFAPLHRSIIKNLPQTSEEKETKTRLTKNSSYPPVVSRVYGTFEDLDPIVVDLTSLESHRLYRSSRQNSYSIQDTDSQLSSFSIAASERDESVRENKRSEYCKCSFFTYCCVKEKIFFSLLSASFIINGVNELVDSKESISGNINLFPFPDDPDILAIVPNNNATLFIFSSGVALYVIGFDYSRMREGFSKTMDMLKNKSFPEEWTRARIPRPKLKAIILGCSVIAFFSILNEIFNSISIGIDNSENEEDESSFIPIELAIVSAILGNLGFIFCEAFKLPDVVIGYFDNKRGIPLADGSVMPYPLAYEVISLIPRLAGALGSGLFALDSIKTVLGAKAANATSTNLGQAFMLLGLNSTKMITSFAYEGEFTIEVLSQLFNALGEIRRGVLPKLSEFFGTVSAISFGGTLAFLQQKLTETYLDDMTDSTFIKKYLLAPLTMIYAYQMWINYAGTYYPPLQMMFSKTGSCLTHGISKITNLCSRKNTPHEEYEAIVHDEPRRVTSRTQSLQVETKTPFTSRTQSAPYSASMRAGMRTGLLTFRSVDEPDYFTAQENKPILGPKKSRGCCSIM